MLLAGIPGVPDGTAVTASRPMFEIGVPALERRLHFATYGDPVFDALLAHLATFDLPECIRRLEVDVPDLPVTVVAYAVAHAGQDGAHLRCFPRPQEAVRGADLVTTDVWTSMGFEAEAEERKRRFAAYQVSRELMKLAAPDALFMHCLPAHRGEEVDAAVIDGPQSVVWDEAENRLHTQKSLMEYLLLGKIQD